MSVEIVAICILTVCIFGGVALFHKLFPKTSPEDSDTMTSPSSPPAAPSTPPTDSQDSQKPLTGREAQDQRIKARIQTRLCLFCDEHAYKQMPTFKPQRSLLDGVYRMLNVVPLDRYKIVLDRGIEVPFTLCEKHHERVRGLFEKRIAKAAADVADFFDEQRQNLYIFERYELYERVDTDMNAAKRGKPKVLPTPTTKNVVDIKSVKKIGNDNSG